MSSLLTFKLSKARLRTMKWWKKFSSKKSWTKTAESPKSNAHVSSRNPRMTFLPT